MTNFDHVEDKNFHAMLNGDVSQEMQEAALDAATDAIEQVSAGDTLRDAAGNTYFVRGCAGDGWGAVVQVTRQSDQQERDVRAATVRAMLESGQMWKEPKAEVKA